MEVRGAGEGVGMEVEDPDMLEPEAPRREVILNRYLPYADRINAEAAQKLAEIKANLGRSVMLRELKPGCFYWANQLATYLYGYGRKFSKEDHVVFIKLLYELVTIPDLEFFLIDHFSRVLAALLKKKELLSRKELVLPWRPLYELYERVAYNKWEKKHLIRIPTPSANVVHTLIQVCRTYFPAESTQEMLDEWKPLLCPFAGKQMNKAMELLELFLPTEVFPEEHAKTHEVWFNDMMQIWESCHTTPSWEFNIVNLFARLAECAVGYIDWTPFIPMIFTRLLRSFHLPVYVKQVRFQTTKEHYDISAVTTLLVAMMGGSDVCQQHLSHIFLSLESFYHPSNSGAWNIRLQQLLAKLTCTFVRRLRYERRLVKTWEPEVPESHRLTEDDITAFVKCIKPCVLLAMFAKSGCNDATIALKNLAVLRPELIVPSILERFYPATETLIEPHRLLAVVQCLAYVLVPMVRGGKYLPEGPTHVLPVLMSCLPGIDPNDGHKTSATFQLIACLATLVPFVDCSQMVQDHKDLSEMERELCSSTAQFEDFVLQFMDKCFVLIESASSEASMCTDRVTEAVNAEEEQLQFGMSNVFSIILNQCSPEICKSAVRKLCNFLKGRIFEIKDSGYLAAKLLRATTFRTNANLTLKKLLPTICEIIDDNLPEGGNISANADRELLFNMLLLQELVCSDGPSLLPYRDILTRVLTRIVTLNDKEGRTIACQIIKNLLTSLTTTYFVEQQSQNPTSDSDQDLPIRNWGSLAEVSKVKISWHTSNEDELKFAQELVNTFLTNEMDRLSNWMEDKLVLTRDQLQQSVATVHAVLLGCLARCPLWDGLTTDIADSITTHEHPSYVIHENEAVITLNGENLRFTLLQWLRKLTVYLLQHHEDNIPVMRYVVKLYHHLVFFWGNQHENYRKDYKWFSVMRKILDNPLRRKKYQLRYLFIHRVNFQHQMRVIDYAVNRFSELHRLVMCDLLNLATSRYTEIRSLSQWVLGECYLRLPMSCRRILPELTELAENTASFPHEKLKGVLFVLLGEQHSYCLLTRRDWDSLCKLWPTIIKTPISDRPSINILLDNLVNKITKTLVTFAIEEQVSSSAEEAAKELWKNSPTPLHALPSTEDIEKGLAELKQRNEINLRNYNQLVTQQVALLEAPNVHWQSFQLGIEMLIVLIRHDTPLPIEAVRLMLRSLLHDTPNVRFWAITGIVRVLQQTKPACIKIEADPAEMAGKDLLHYDWHKNGTMNAEEWDRTLFLDKPHLGFYCWPKVLRLHASAKQQASRFQSREAMSQASGEVYDFFASPANIDQLVKYLSAELNKDRDKLELYKCDLFRFLFRNYGDKFLHLFLPHLKELIAGSLDSQKRCAVEIMAGIVAGSKYWTHDMLVRLWEALSPILKTAWSSVTCELADDWIQAMKFMVENSDPRRQKWLLELLLENLLVSSDGSFVEANRLMLLFNAVSEQVWKVPQLLHHILDIIKPHLAHSYQNIRDELGRLLSLVFQTNVHVRPFPNGHRGPSQKDFVDYILPKLEAFENTMSAASNHSNGLPAEVDGMITLADDGPEWKASVALLKTVCRWLRRRLVKSLQIATPDIIRLLPVLCQGEACDRDPELQKSCRLAIAVLGHAYLPPNMVAHVLQSTASLSENASWRARKTALEYLQVLVFSNLFTILHHPNSVSEISKVVLKLLEDPRTEVQKMAALVLSGIFHCKIMSAEQEQALLSSFITLSKTDIKKSSSNSFLDPDDLRRRHAGILGMSAFVTAHPYDIRDGMPEILVSLGTHLHDPQPVQTTVRQTLTNFRRTHHDNWQDHKLKFTDDQLSLINDWLISPNYYA